MSRRSRLAVLFGAGLLLRLWFLPLPTSDDDLYMQDWALRAAAHGVDSVYDPSVGSIRKMHPPLNYYFLWAVGTAYKAVVPAVPPEIDRVSIGLMAAVKLPNLAADLLIALVLFLVACRQAGDRVGTAVLCAYLFNPAMIWEATFVGQIEAVQTLPILLAVVLLMFNRVELSWAALALAFLTKPQGAVIVPLVLLFSVLVMPVRRLVHAAVVAGAVALLVVLPWLMSNRLTDVSNVYTTTVDTHPYLTVNAANAWTVVAAIKHEGFAIGGGGVDQGAVLISDADRVPVLPVLTYKRLGLLLFLAVYGFALWSVYRRPDRVTLAWAASLVFFAFFMLPTQMTERYLFPFVPLMAVLVALAPTGRMMGIFVAASATFMLNLYLVFPLPAVLPWNVVSNVKYPLAHAYLDIPDPYRAPLTLALAVVNVMVFAMLVWSVPAKRRRMPGTQG